MRKGERGYAFAFSLVFALALLAGCASATTPDQSLFLPSDIKPSPRANLLFSYLKMEQAMRRDDVDALLGAVDVILKEGPASRPLADAAGWLLGKRRADEARALLQASVKALPDDFALHMMLAETMLETKDSDGAIALVQSYLQRHPEQTDARIELALLCLKTEKPRQALDMLNQLPREAMTPSVLYFQAQALRALGDLDATTAKLNEALKEAPDFLEALLELALVEEQREHYAKANALFEKLLTYDPGNQDILLRLMTIALRQGNPDRAYQIASQSRDSYSFMLSAASMFMNEGRHDLAESLLALLADDPETPGEIVFYQAAAAYEGKRDVERTLGLLATISPESRYYDRALKLRTQILYENGRLTEALDIMREARAAYPNDREFKLAEADLLIALDRKPEAMAHMERMLAEDPSDSNLAFRHAFMVETSGDRPRAIALMEDLLKRFPDDYQAMNFIGYTLAEENRDLDRALSLIARAVELSPDSDYIVDSLAWVQYRLGKFQEAWNNIRRAVELSGERHDPTMWDHYGDIAFALGLKDEAQKGWEKSLSLDPGDPAVVTTIRAKLEQL